MPCFHPLKGYWSKDRNPSGKRSLTFNAREGFTDKKIDIPCGRCIGCRLERSRQWAIRCIHEASLYDDNSFITLTYSPEKTPSDGSLKVEDFQNFMKRLRKSIYPDKVRFFHCGEYGEKGDRPHYHAILFNKAFKDREVWKKTPTGVVYRSKELEKLWTDGFSSVGDVTFESAAYVARYIMKKRLGGDTSAHYEGVDLYTGEITQRKPEYITMSRRPGVGKGWFDKWKGDAFPSDFIIVREKKSRPPKYYAKQLEAEDPRTFAKVKAKRKVRAEKKADDNTHERLLVKEWIQYDKIKNITRSYENGVDNEDV